MTVRLWPGIIVIISGAMLIFSAGIQLGRRAVAPEVCKTSFYEANAKAEIWLMRQGVKNARFTCMRREPQLFACDVMTEDSWPFTLFCGDEPDCSLTVAGTK